MTDEARLSAVDSEIGLARTIHLPCTTNEATPAQRTGIRGDKQEDEGQPAISHLRLDFLTTSRLHRARTSSRAVY